MKSGAPPSAREVRTESRRVYPDGPDGGDEPLRSLREPRSRSLPMENRESGGYSGGPPSPQAQFSCRGVALVFSAPICDLLPAGTARGPDRSEERRVGEAGRSGGRGGYC